MCHHNKIVVYLVLTGTTLDLDVNKLPLVGRSQCCARISPIYTTKFLALIFHGLLKHI